MSATGKYLRYCVLVTVFIGCIWPGSVVAAPEDYFKIQVVDRQTGRGVPLVELRTTNNIRYFTDSNGVVAFYEPGLMGADVFFFVESHGYEHPKDGFGMRGKRFKAVGGGSGVIKIDRINIAERLYRVTGAGIYRDSVLTGHPVPIKDPVLNGRVMGQDSVYTVIYRGRLFWFWGDTGRPRYPLGHFGMAGALSSLPGKGGLDPDIGVDLEYFVDENGFSRRMCRMKEKGMYWLDGFLTVRDPAGDERIVARYARMKSLAEAHERGLMTYDDKSESFEYLVRSASDFPPYPAAGHTFGVNVDGEAYYYFATQFPMAVRMRVKDDWLHVCDINRHEVLTSIGGNKEPRWVSIGKLLADGEYTAASLTEALQKEKTGTRLYDVETGKAIIPHGGSVYFNTHRNKWIMVTVQQFGASSMLGEVWYAEADTPVGPWVYARKIATHNKYSFYNPMQHPYFDKDGGRVIYFEGTYTHTFSGSLETATPRYDYNQIMYRLRLEDERLRLPVAVYRVDGDYRLRDAIEKGDKWEAVEFFAVEPGRGDDGLTAIYQVEGRLTAERPNRSAMPLFYAMRSNEAPIENPQIVPLFEYRNTKTGQSLYSCEETISKEGWKRGKKPLCRVWKTPPDMLIDAKARPIASD